jgi:hypothetical protein
MSASQTSSRAPTYLIQAVITVDRVWSTLACDDIADVISVAVAPAYMYMYPDVHVPECSADFALL